MCDVTARSRHPRVTPRPQWWSLYGVAALMLAAFLGAEVVRLSDPARAVVRCAIALGGFAGMAVWERWNRAALDQQRWCECAAATITVRVIRSHRPASFRPAVPAMSGSPLLEEKVGAEEEPEAATR